MRRTTTAPLAVVAIAAASVLGGCGGGSKHSASSTTNTTASTVAAASAGGSGNSRHGGSAATGAAAATSADPTAPPAAAVHDARALAGKLPASVAATVAGQPITLSAYRQAYAAQVSSLTGSGVPLDAPGFSRCAAALAHLFARLDTGKGAHLPRPSHGALVKECQARERGLGQSVMTQLIQRLWIAGQAKADGVSVSDAQVAAAVASQQRALGGAAAYARYLKRTGQSAQQASASLRLGLIDQQLQQRNLGAPVSVSQQAAAAFFAAHHAEFVLPGQPKPRLATYQARIRLLLGEQVRSRRALAATLAYERRWRAVTICRPGYVVSLCANG